MQEQRDFGLEAASLNQLLHMADSQPGSSNPQLALLQTLQSQLPQRIIAGTPQKPVMIMLIIVVVHVFQH